MDFAVILGISNCHPLFIYVEVVEKQRNNGLRLTAFHVSIVWRSVLLDGRESRVAISARDSRTPPSGRQLVYGRISRPLPPSNFKCYFHSQQLCHFAAIDSTHAEWQCLRVDTLSMPNIDSSLIFNLS